MGIIETLAKRFSEKTTQTLVTAANTTSSLKSITELVKSGNANTKTPELAQAVSAASIVATGVSELSSIWNSGAVPSTKGAYVAGVAMQLNLALASASMVLATAYFKEGNISAGIATTFSAISAVSNAVETAASVAPGINQVETIAAAGGAIFSFASVIISNYADSISKELVDAAEKLRENTNKLKEQLRQQDPFSPSNMLAPLSPWIHLPYKRAKYHIVDPLALDLDGNGIRTVAANQFSGSLFDHDGDGIRTASGWVGKEDGLLVYDRNGDGIINNGSELFGDATRLKNGSTAEHGFAALADLDDNGDGKIDAADKVFSSLRVWRDLNQDGISQEGELLTLEQAKVRSLNTQFRNTNRSLGDGNTLAQEGSYTTTDGQTRQMGDLLLTNDPLFSRFNNKVALTAEQLQNTLSQLQALRNGKVNISPEL